MTPIWIDVTSDSQTPGAPQGSFQCFRVGLPSGFHEMLDFL
jgi:hypothetical protein